MLESDYVRSAILHVASPWDELPTGTERSYYALLASGTWRTSFPGAGCLFHLHLSCAIATQ